LELPGFVEDAGDGDRRRILWDLRVRVSVGGDNTMGSLLCAACMHLIEVGGVLLRVLRRTHVELSFREALGSFLGDGMSMSLEHCRWQLC